MRVGKMSRTKPVEQYLVSHSVPFKLCPATGVTKAVSPKFLSDEIYLPDARTEGWSMKLPWMVEELILQHLVVQLLKGREFEDALGVMCLTRRLFMEWSDRIGGGDWRTFRHRCRGTSRMLFLLNEIGERAIDQPVLRKKSLGWPGLAATPTPDVLQQVLEEQVLDDMSIASQEGDDADMLTQFHFPVLNMENPFWTHTRNGGGIPPTSLVGRGPHGLDMDMSVTGYIDGIVVFSDFQKASATGGWVGRRLCDLMLIDADAEQGIFYATQVVFPVILLCIKAPADGWAGTVARSQTTGAWERALKGWETFSELLALAFEGCGLYIEKPDLPEGQWGCRYFQRVGKNVPPDVQKSNAW